MKLYFMPGACSLASLISLYEAGITVELAKVDKRTKRVDGEDFTRINPKGYVPALRLDDGEVLTENIAVLQYIADRKPQSKLAPPAGTLERYRLMEWLGFINSELHKSFGPLFNAEAKDEVKQYTRHNLQKRLDWLQSAWGTRKFLMGDQFTVADAYLYVVLSWASHVGFDLSKWPQLKVFFDRVASRPQVIAARKAEGLKD
jgi:glutathione S-transferase